MTNDNEKKEGGFKMKEEISEEKSPVKEELIKDINEVIEGSNKNDEVKEEVKEVEEPEKSEVSIDKEEVKVSNNSEVKETDKKEEIKDYESDKEVDVEKKKDISEVKHETIKEHAEKKHEVHHEVKHHAKPTYLSKQIMTMIAIFGVLLLVNQFQINALSDSLGGMGTSHRETDLSNLDLSQLKSTGHTIAAVFPLEDIKTAEDAMAVMFPTGTPEYGEALGVSYDDPVTSLETMAAMYNGLKAEVEKSNPEAFQRFVNLASNPYGVSCEYCCGIGPIGADKQGKSRCGCAHNPGILTLALYLSTYTDYTDGEILRESMKWKTLWFPKNMIELGASLAGGDTSALKDLPGMVGGC